MKACNQHILKALELVDEMLDLADVGDVHRQDVGCGILYGVIRDSAFKIKQLAQKEKRAHIRKGLWVNENQPNNSNTKEKTWQP